MSLYIVVRHPKNPDQNYTNEWKDDNRLLLAITTPKEVAMSLAAEKEINARVFVHRCRWDGLPARICCSMLVGQIEPLDRREYLVKFIDPKPMDFDTQIAAHEGQNFYYAPPPKEGTI